MDQNGGRNLRFGRTNPIFLSEIKGSGPSLPDINHKLAFQPAFYLPHQLCVDLA